MELRVKLARDTYSTPVVYFTCYAIYYAAAAT